MSCGLTSPILVASLLAWPAFLACAQDNLFTNPGFERLDDTGRPEGWAPVDFGTGGKSAVGTDGGHTGDTYVVLSATENENRSCWRQQVLWPNDGPGVTVSGWYRTRGVAAGDGKGASIRFLFNDDPNKWHHLKLETVFFPPSEQWRFVSTTLEVPEGTRAVVIELFHWYTPGETHWDDVTIQVATAEQLAAMPLPPSIAVDREPTLGRNLPYSPADGERVTLNPPPFRWLPSGAEAAYRLQVARDDRFEGDMPVDLEGLQWACEMLAQTLEPGTWYWRYGVDRGRPGVAWSRARRFEVPADADPWPYPAPEAFLVPRQRPHLFFRPEEMGEYRRRASEGDLKAYAEGLVRATRGWAEEELVPEPYFLPGGEARSPQYVIYIRTTRPPMDRMETAALAYLLTGDEACGAEAKRRLLHFFSWDPSGATSVFHNDEPAMWVMMRGIRAYDWTYDLFTPQEREQVEGSMRVRAADFYKKLRGMPFENNPFESHAGRIIGFLGEAAVEFHNQWPEAQEWLQYITRIYWGVYPAWGKDDGGWNEGPGYWSAYMSFGLHFVVALRQATGIDLSQRPFFRNTPYYLLYLTPPFSQMAPFGDGTQWKPSRPGALMYWFSTLTQDPYIRWYTESLGQGSGGGPLGVVLRDDGLKGQAPLDLPLARQFPGVGLAALHTNLADGAEDVSFLLRSSPYGAVSHGHNDQNCFVLEAYGEALAIASGYYNYYGSPHHDKWTRQTKAKCGITFDGGQGQDRGWQAQGAITDFIHGRAFDLVTGDATRAYGGRLSRALREVVHVRPGIFVIRDDLASDEPRTFEFWLHSIDQMDVSDETRSVVIKRPKATLTTRFLAPGEIDLRQTDQFDPHPAWPEGTEYARNWHVTASFTAPAEEGEFLSVLLPAKAGEEALLPATRALKSDTARGVELTWPDGRRTIVGFALPGVEGAVALEGVGSDGRVFAVSFAPDGSPEDSLLSRGTSLRVGERELGER